MLADRGGGAQPDTPLTTDELAPVQILVMQQHILLLKYRRGELHVHEGSKRGRLLNGGRGSRPA